MNAKEMFEKLGYECDIGSDGILYSKYIDLKNGDIAICHINFDKVDKTIEKDVSGAMFSMKHYNSKITLEELKAIQQQLKELEWLDE